MPPSDEVNGRSLGDLASPEDRFATGLAGQADVTSALKFTVEFLMQALGAGSASIFITEPGEKELLLAEIRGQGREPLVGLRRSIDDGITGWVARRREPVLVRNVEADGRFAGMRNVEGHYGTESFIATPMLRGDELVGVINLTDKIALKPFDQKDMDLLVGLAGRAAEVLSELIRAEREVLDGRSLAEKIDLARAELHRATEQLDQLTGLNESILECLPLPVIAFDRSLHARFFNTAARELFGPELASASLLKLPIELSEGTWASRLPEAVEAGRSLSFDEATFRPADARARVIKIAISPTSEANAAGDAGPSDAVGGMMVVEDIDSKVRLQRQLAQAERLAGIGRLSASVAHELNNPIDGVLRYMGLVLKVEPDNERLGRYMTECRRGLMRMARIVSSLLEYSRSSRKAERLRPLPEMLREALRLLEQRRRKTNVHVEIDIGYGLEKPVKDCMVQCFVNVIRNAFDAMPEGGTLSIRARELRGEAEVTFTDTGPGIPDDAIGRVFDPFYTTRGDAEKAGLGLAICQDLTQQCGGRLDAGCAPGKGATFRFRIPLD